MDRLANDVADECTRVVTESLFITTAQFEQAMKHGMSEGMSASYAALDALLAR
jgi:hypothetical protein